ncbi:ATP-binding protein [Lentzea sp. CC55]|uniref:sensor histidine kinase n=1 Tax=Lentzea sp. CC55 TaxID=2884909 RepID=UPI001F298A03|nr:GAF domain-containing sensor histidine kinase [Lentzea sp. CC55]MCG8927363.1 GAF domain-containing sensor histidine kinase [Lentzea sp. CC55]
MAVEQRDRDSILAEYGIEDLGRQSDLEALAELAAQVCGVPHGAVNLIGEHLQHQVAAVGISPSICSREDSMCAVSIVTPEPVEVPDARQDPRFATNPFVTGRIASVRFYAASRLQAPSGAVLGTLCVFDDVPHRLDRRQRRSLDLLAHQAVDVLELRRSSLALARTVEELTAARAELLRSNSELADFAGRVSHDLRNPLAGIVGFLELLSDHPAVVGAPTAGRLVGRSRGAANRMHALVDGLLEYAKLGGQLKYGSVDLGTLLGDLIDDRATGAGTETMDLNLEPLPMVRGDKTHLRALLQNIVGNAVRFARPDRRLVVRIRAEHRGQFVRVEIADNGRGIPPERREEAFALLSQVHQHGTVEGGAGIGLATCRRVATAHGGTIGLSDGIDGGLTVWFTLPAGSAGRG